MIVPTNKQSHSQGFVALCWMYMASKSRVNRVIYIHVYCATLKEIKNLCENFSKISPRFALDLGVDHSMFLAAEILPRFWWDLGEILGLFLATIFERAQHSQLPGI